MDDAAEDGAVLADDNCLREGWPAHSGKVLACRHVQSVLSGLGSSRPLGWAKWVNDCESGGIDWVVCNAA